MSKGIFLNGRWVEVRQCFDCGGCQESNEYSWCFYLCELLKCESGDHRVSIGDTALILDNCPLPDWDLVRDHGADEVPPHHNDVTLTVKDTECENRKIKIQAYYRDGHWRRRENFRFLPKRFVIVSWRHILWTTTPA